MNNEGYVQAANQWVDDFQQFLKDKKKGNLSEYFSDIKYYWEYGSPPDEEYFLPYDPQLLDDTAWYQVYQTVSEGTPVTPPFATQDELINYLVEHGDFWWQKEHHPYDKPPSRKAAENFVKISGWCPSMSIEDGVLTSGIQQCENLTGDLHETF
jgi:hypothetical protein